MGLVFYSGKISISNNNNKHTGQTNKTNTFLTYKSNYITQNRIENSTLHNVQVLKYILRLFIENEKEKKKEKETMKRRE